MSDVLTHAVLIVDDEPAMRQRLKRVLATLGHAETPIHAAGGIAQGKAIAGRDAALALALIDLGLPDGNGVELVRWLRARDEALPILVISAWSTEDMILGALRAGASGYVLKERENDELAASIRNVLKGGAPIDPFIARRILGLIGEPIANSPAEPEPDIALRHSLSERELAILAQVADGLSDREIAQALNVSRWTIDSHIRHIYNKLAVNSRTQALKVARSHGLLR